MSEIGNKAPLFGLARWLKIMDVKQAPAQLDTDNVKVVAPLDPSWGGYTQWTVAGSNSIAGVETWQWEIVGEDVLPASSPPLTSATLRSNGREVVILGIYIALNYSGAGLAADVAAGISCSLVKSRALVGNPSFINESILPRWYLATAASAISNTYHWSHPEHQQQITGAPGPIVSMPPIHVPAGSRYMISCGRSTASNFPADTYLTVMALGVYVPEGFKPPTL